MSAQFPQMTLRFRSNISDSEKARRLQEFIDTMNIVHDSLSMSGSVPIILCAARTTLAATYLLFNGRTFSNGSITKMLTLEDIEWTMGGALEVEFYGDLYSKHVASRLTSLYASLAITGERTCWISDDGIELMDSLMRSDLGEPFVIPAFITDLMEGTLQ